MMTGQIMRIAARVNARDTNTRSRLGLGDDLPGRNVRKRDMPVPTLVITTTSTITPASLFLVTDTS
jgi:hypothetical protein